MMFSIYASCWTMALAASPGPAPARVVREWVFDKPGDLRGWVPTRLEDVCAGADGLSFRSPGPDPQLYRPKVDPFAASNQQVVEITWDCSDSGTGELFFSNTDQGQHGGLRPTWRTVIHVERTGEQVTVVRPFWQQLGKIIQIRVDPPSDTTVRLRRIRIVEPAAVPAEQPEWRFDQSTANAWFSLANVRSMVISDGALTLTSSSREAVALGAIRPTPAAKRRWVRLDLQAKSLSLVSLCWASDGALGLSRRALMLDGSAGPQHYALDMADVPGWQGNITHLGIGFAAAPDERVRLRALAMTEQPTGPAYLQCRFFGPVDTIIRPDRPASMALWLRNVGGAVRPASDVRFVCPSGTKVSPAQATCPAVEPGKTAKITCTLTAAKPGCASVKIEVGEQTFTRSIEVAPAVAQTKARYVPMPRPIETTHDIGIYYFPGWSPEQTKRWSHQLEFPERRPLLGLYREGDPEVADWHIKWAVENGIRLFIYDWYWRDGKEFIGRGLNEGFLQARYRNLLEFCVMWANHENFASHTREQLLTVTDYWADHYWQRRNYRRHEGKPVVVFFAPAKLTEYLGSAEKVKSAFDAMRARARERGFPGIWFVGCGGYTVGGQRQLAAMGFDACSAYNYAGAGASTRHSPYEVLMAGHEPIWRRAIEAGVLPYTPLLTTGWDSRPWHGDGARVRYGRSTAKWADGLRRLRAFLEQHRLKEGWLEAWNEWGEGSYIEPNVEFGFADLEAIRRTFGRPGTMPVNVGPRDVGRGPYEIEMFRKGETKEDPIVKTQGKNPNVIEGLDVVCRERSVTVTAGRCRVGGKTVSVKETELAVDPAESVAVDDEMHPISDEKVLGWRGGTRLVAGRTPFRVMPSQLAPNSLLIQAAAKRTATCYECDKDYVLDEFWGALSRLPKGRIKPKQRVAISYVYGLRRVDRIEVMPDGTVTLRRGQPKVDCPVMPPKTRGAMTLATVYRPYHARYVRAHHVYVVDEVKAAERLKPDTGPVARTLAKLRAGKPVTIVCWGDSVTTGGDASRPEKRYVDLFATRLRERFGDGEIKVINAGIGGTSTHGRLRAYPKEVLAYKPDLITVEFVNDMGLPGKTLRANWTSAIDQARKIGAEFVIITPHYVMPSWMSKRHSRGPETRANCKALRALATEQKVGLADAAWRWERLELAGIPYEILLKNGINHPDDRGHAIFVEELMRLFPR